jgi:uncharacterized membrane protein YtjA (UPF0391 family)
MVYYPECLVVSILGMVLRFVDASSTMKLTTRVFVVTLALFVVSVVGADQDSKHGI